MYTAVPAWTNTSVLSSAAYATVTGLTVGRCMKVRAIPYFQFSIPNATTNLIASFAYENPFVPVTCGCPPMALSQLVTLEPTGAPGSLLVTQKYGKMYLRWVDRSLCESGFALTRNGNLFAPTYFIQAAQQCGVPHAPTSIYDDLVNAQLQDKVLVGTRHSYCVRAINPTGCDPAGSYVSTPTCQNVQIAWESSLSGIVVGKQETGNAPVPEVTIKYTFVKYPNIRGGGVTNMDGIFVESGTSEPGINVQVGFGIWLFLPYITRTLMFLRDVILIFLFYFRLFLPLESRWFALRFPSPAAPAYIRSTISLLVMVYLALVTR
jgi:hypothetical protein